MSRSHGGKSGKGPGYEYWSRRPGNQGGQGPSKYGGRSIKTRTHRLERLQGKEDVRRERDSG